jgi:hypothetical protein
MSPAALARLPLGSRGVRRSEIMSRCGLFDYMPRGPVRLCTQHVFKLEQQLYKDEQLNVGEIPFEDNQLCLDLIELKGGVLAMLDEECVVPNGSDKGFCEKLWNT